MSLRRATRRARMPLAVLVVACAFTCSAGASRSAAVAPVNVPASHATR